MAKDENRLYFIVRSIILNSIGGGMFLATIWYMGTIDFIRGVVIGTCIFVFSLAISSFFDSQIGKLAGKILKVLDRHHKLKRIVLNYF